MILEKEEASKGVVSHLFSHINISQQSKQNKVQLWPLESHLFNLFIILSFLSFCNQNFDLNVQW